MRPICHFPPPPFPKKSTRLLPTHRACFHFPSRVIIIIIISSFENLWSGSFFCVQAHFIFSCAQGKVTAAPLLFCRNFFFLRAYFALTLAQKDRFGKRARIFCFLAPTQHTKLLRLFSSTVFPNFCECKITDKPKMQASQLAGFP